MRRLYYRDSYGRVRRDHQAERASSGGSVIPAKVAVLVLVVLAVFVVFASLGH